MHTLTCLVLELLKAHATVELLNRNDSVELTFQFYNIFKHTLNMLNIKTT